MSFFETLFGRQKPVPPGVEKLFAMSTAQVAMETEQSLTPAGVAAMCFKGIASGPFGQIQRDLDQLLQVAGKDDSIAYRSYQDDLGYSWLIFTGSDFQGLVTTLHMSSSTLLDQGYGSQLLFAIFAFKDADGHSVYWIYNYKRSTFYPFVPQKDSHDRMRQRNNPEEMRLATALGKELPMEPELERWYAVWDLPF